MLFLPNQAQAYLIFLPNQAQAHLITNSEGSFVINSLDVTVVWDAIGHGHSVYPFFSFNGTIKQYDYHICSYTTEQTKVTLKTGENIFRFYSNNGGNDDCGCREYHYPYDDRSYVLASDGVFAQLTFYLSFFDQLYPVYISTTDKNWEGFIGSRWIKGGVSVIGCPYAYDGRCIVSLSGSYLQTATCGDCCQTNIRKVFYVDSTYVISPPSASIPVGQTQQFIGWYDPDGPSGSEAQQDKTASATWVSSNTSIATINSSALATCQAVGSATIKSVYNNVFTATAKLNCYDPALPPTVDLKVNSSDGPITIPSGSSATLSWSSLGADSCEAFGDWSGTKATSGSQSTGKLTNSKTYILTCTNANGSVSDNVTVNLFSYVVAPPSASTPINQTQQFIGWYDPDGPDGPEVEQDKTASATWSIPTSGWFRFRLPATPVATIDSSGSATCQIAGSATVKSTYNNITATASLTCYDPTVQTAPTATNLRINSEPDYCSASPAISFAWDFFDAEDGSVQTACRLEVATNSDFSDIAYDSGWNNTASTVKFVSIVNPGFSGIPYDDIYYWRVTVKDSSGQTSSPVKAARTFRINRHPYPTIDFSWLPTNPRKNDKVDFTDLSEVYGGANKSSWLWNFQDGLPATASTQNPSATFASQGQKTITLRVTDSDHFACEAAKILNVQLGLPKWKEIFPW